jgi:hypothetical protein
MKIIRSFLLIAFAVGFGVLRSRGESPESWDGASTMMLAAIIAAWLLLSRRLIGYIDARNRTHRVAGFAGFLGLLLSVFAVESLSFSLKRTFSPATDLATSFQSDAAWLVVFPLLFYYLTNRKTVNQTRGPTSVSITPHADK